MELPAPIPAAVSEPNDGSNEVASFVADLSNSIKNGYLFMQDPIDKVGVAMCVGVAPLHMGVAMCGRGITAYGCGHADVGAALLCADSGETVLH